MEVEKYKMIYEVKDKGNFKRILGEESYKNNYNKEKMIYNNIKIAQLRGLFNLKNIMNDHLKIKMILNKDSYNKIYMFKDCSSLMQFKFNSNIYNNDEKDILFDNDNILDFDYNNKNINNDNNSQPDISKWKILNVIDTNKMSCDFLSVNYINYLNENYLSFEIIPDLFFITNNIFNKNSEFEKKLCYN